MSGHDANTVSRQRPRGGGLSCARAAESVIHSGPAGHSSHQLTPSHDPHRFRVVAIVKTFFSSGRAVVPADVQARLLAQRRVAQATVAPVCVSVRPVSGGIAIAYTSISAIPPMVQGGPRRLRARTHDRSAAPAKSPVESA